MKTIFSNSFTVIFSDDSFIPDLITIYSEHEIYKLEIWLQQGWSKRLLKSEVHEESIAVVIDELTNRKAVRVRKFISGEWLLIEYRYYDKNDSKLITL